ncbi:MAG: nitroreductase family protein [Clostridiaceae bacterium]|nr:nitroreductase family protein [Clostridiaceae bacterium]
MKAIDLLKPRRSYYSLNDQTDVKNETIIKTIQEVTALVPDAFDMKSQKVLVVLGDKHKELWDLIYDVFDGKVAREKIDMFKAGVGTVLFFVDKNIVDTLANQFSNYAENFKPWALQSNGMLQINIWTALRELGLGANLQHYNPVIDDKVKEMFDLSEDSVLLAQMVFGNIVEEPEAKEKEDISARVKVAE